MGRVTKAMQLSGGINKTPAQLFAAQTVTFEAQSAHIRKVAFSAAIDDRDDVIGIPEGLSALHFPLAARFGSGRASQSLHPAQLGDAVEAAHRADTLISLEYAVAEVTRIAAKLPFFDAPIGAEREPAGRDFEIAPATEAAAVRASRQRSAIGSPPGHSAPDAHKNRIDRKCSPHV